MQEYVVRFMLSSTCLCAMRETKNVWVSAFVAIAGNAVPSERRILE